MSEIDDHNIEKFFRNGSDRYDEIPFVENDWNSLEKRLDAYDAHRTAKRWRYIIIGSFVTSALLIASLYFYQEFLPDPSEDALSTSMDGELNTRAAGSAALTVPRRKNDSKIDHSDNANQQYANRQNTGGNSTAAADEEKDKTQIILSKDLINGINDNDSQIRNGQQNKLPEAQRKENTSRLSKSQESTMTQTKGREVNASEGSGFHSREMVRDSNIPGRHVMRRAMEVGDSKRQTKVNLPSAQKSSGMSATDNDPAHLEGLSTAEEKEKSEDFSVKDVLEDTTEMRAMTVVHSRESVDHEGKEENHSEISDSVQREIVKVQVKDHGPADDDTSGYNPVWSVAIVVSPDFSSTGLGSQFTAPGESFGLMLQYNFGNRWAVATGMIRSTKKYIGTGHDYQPPTGYWQYTTNGAVPDMIDGTCVVFELPLQIRFNIMRGQRGTVFATGGVSSYIMTSELYEYRFNDSNPGAASDWATDENSTYWLGIGSFSLGYEHRVGKKVSLSVEPYVKVPFAGVGWADVKLFTTGAYFSLRYHFARGKHPPPEISR